MNVKFLGSVEVSPLVPTAVREIKKEKKKKIEFFVCIR